MTRTFARTPALLAVMIVLFVGIFSTSCATAFRNKEDILNASRAVQLKIVGGLEKPGIRVFSVDEQGFVNVEDRFPGRSSEELLTRLNKPDRQALFSLVDSLEALELRAEYQIGEDATTYTLSVYHNGTVSQTTRFSSGVPRVILRILEQLEKILENE
jgi:hypothetical protein